MDGTGEVQSHLPQEKHLSTILKYRMPALSGTTRIKTKLFKWKEDCMVEL
jgi:hypothetical protein